jgi:hypothetical protein
VSNPIPVTRRFDRPRTSDRLNEWWGSLYVVEPNVVGVISDAGNYLATAVPAEGESMLAFVAGAHVDALANRLTKEIEDRRVRSLAYERLRTHVLPPILPLVRAAHQATQTVTLDLPAGAAA